MDGQTIALSRQGIVLSLEVSKQPELDHGLSTTLGILKRFSFAGETLQQIARNIKQERESTANPDLKTVVFTWENYAK